MNIIDATWEEKNLGVTCYEVIFDDDDKISDVEDNWENFLKRHYLVLKVPNTRPDITAYVKSMGARYIESTIIFQCKLRTWQPPELLKKVLSESSYAPMNDAEIEVMLNEIRNGIFKTDRIYLDPYFTHEQAAQRYVNWSLDLLKRGDIPYKVIYDNDTVGFFNDAWLLFRIYRSGYGRFHSVFCT